MGTLLHGVVVAGASRSIVASSDDTSALEPLPWRANLTTVAAHGAALTLIAAARCVGDGQKGCVCTTCGDADTIIQGLSGTVSPA